MSDEQPLDYATAGVDIGRSDSVKQRIRAVVGYGAGGGADSLIRAIAPELGEALGQQIGRASCRERV